MDLTSLLKRTKGISIALGLWGLAVALAPLQEQFAARLSLLQYAPCFLPGIIAFVLLRCPTLELSAWAWPLTILPGFGIRLFGFRAGWLAWLLLEMAAPQFRDFTWHPLYVAAEKIAVFLRHLFEPRHRLLVFVHLLALLSAQYSITLLCRAKRRMSRSALSSILEKRMLTKGIHLSRQLV